jgi:hypothetical protein
MIDMKTVEKRDENNTKCPLDKITRRV